MESTTIGSLTEYVDCLTQGLIFEHEYVFRGQSNDIWPVSSSAARRLNRYHPENVSKEEFQEYHRQLLDEYKKRKLHIVKGGVIMSDLELLGQIQHFEGATGLIDFTSNALVALWFAAIGSPDADGKVGVFNLTSRQDIVSDITADRLRKSMRDLLTFQEFDPEASRLVSRIPRLKGQANDIPELWYWTPAAGSSERIFAQHSRFLFGSPVISDKRFEFSISIKQGKKRHVCDEIEVLFDVSHSRLFSDFGGYSRYCHHQSIAPVYFTGYKYAYKDAFEMLRQNDHSNAARAFGVVIETDNVRDAILAESHFRRGLMRRHLRMPSEAILDFNEAEAIGVDGDSGLLANVYGNRGATYVEEGDEEGLKKAIGDFTKIIDREDSPSDLRARAYFYRATCRCQLDPPQYEEATEDYTRMFAADATIPSDMMAEALIGRGTCWSRRRDMAADERLVKELADYQAVIDMEEAPASLRELAKECIDGLSVQG